MLQIENCQFANHETGFTLIELIVVIVMLGVLAAVAVPKLANMNVNAANAATQGVAAAIASATSLNYLARKAGRADTLQVFEDHVCDAEVIKQLVSGINLINGVPNDSNTFAIRDIPPDYEKCEQDGKVHVCGLITLGGDIQPVRVTCAE